MRKRVILFTFLSAAYGVSWAGLDQWTSVGPSGADITTIGMPGNGGFTFYAGASTGSVYKTTDGAIVSWAAAGSSVGGSISGLAADAGNGSILYLATTNKGFFRSTDGGTNWTAASSGLPAFFGQPATEGALAAHPISSGGLLLGTNAGVYRSADGGITWAASNSGLSVQGPFGASTPTIVALAYESKSGSNVLAGSAVNGIFRSSDGGSSWAAATGIPNGVAVNAIEWATDGKTAYAATASGLYKSSDNGATWSVVAAALVAQGLSTHPTKTATLYAATASGIQRSTDGGISWVALGSFSGAAKAVRVNPAAPFMVVAAGGSGVSEYRVASEMQSPAAFSFPSKDKAPTNVSTESDSVTITGLTEPTVVTVSGGKYKIGLGAYTDKPSLIYNGQSVSVQLTSASTFSTLSSAKLTIGSQAADFKVTTFTATAVSSVTQVISNPGSEFTVGSSGAVTFTGTPTATLSSTAPVNTVIEMQSGQSLKLQAGSSAFTFQNLGGSGGNGFAADPPAYLQVVSCSGDTNLTVAQGSVQVQSSTTGARLPLNTDSSTSCATLTTLGSSTTVVVKRNTDGGVSTNVASGSSVNISSGSTTLELKGQETASLSPNGQQVAARVGSLGGSGSPGDPITPASLSKFADGTRVKLPDLSAAVDRTAGKSLGSVLSEAIVSSLTLGSDTVTSSGYSKDTGLITIALGSGTRRYYLPIGEVTVGSTTRSNRFSATASGTFELASNGLTFTFASALGTYSALEEAVKKIDPAASVQVSEGGVLIVTVSGVKYVGQPGPEATGGGPGGVIPGLETAGGYVVFKDSNGARQTLYPVFASYPWLYGAFRTDFPAVSGVTSNNNGTSTAILGGVPYTLVPEYMLINAPAARQNSEWWMEGSKIYVRYPDLTAQGFALQ